jgi:hypothetical protein
MIPKLNYMQFRLAWPVYKASALKSFNELNPQQAALATRLVQRIDAVKNREEFERLYAYIGTETEALMLRLINYEVEK